MTLEQKKFLRTVLTAVTIGVLGFFVVAWALGQFFSGDVTIPQSFGFGKFQIKFYGLLLALGALAGYWLAMRRREVYRISTDKADSIIFIAIVGGFLGSRIYHVVSEVGFYLQHPAQIIAVWNGGLSIFGAAIGSILAIYLYWNYVLKKNETIFLNLLDWLTPSVIVGQIIGRFGNFVNYELYGYPTALPWKMFVPQMFRLPPYELNQFFHPLFLYEAAGSVIILVLVLKLKMRIGMLFLTWLLLYNVMRFFLEFLRAGSIVYGGIRVNAVVAAILAILAVVIMNKLGYLKFYDKQSSSNN